MKPLLSIVLLPFLVAACGGGGDSDTPFVSSAVAPQTTVAANAPVSSTNPSAKYVNTKTYTFTAAINSATLTPLPDKTIKLVNLIQSGLGTSYALATSADLDALNQKIPTQQRISLDDLGTYTYFLVSAPGCSSYFEYAGNTYSANALTISLNQFTLPNKICLDPLVESYYVIRAAK